MNITRFEMELLIFRTEVASNFYNKVGNILGVLRLRGLAEKYWNLADDRLDDAVETRQYNLWRKTMRN